ncbi:hypothetical protein BAUCODRAFT_410594 [Baudoinia panamericana UAMH 10762]|uniref:RRM domain-containing protein n=1 Tax=Baudoinia panamericana (strain UAMH 10762) TaxID=717646 RepID=M2N274_BAUPA|nr:uncharacterized protein BAUCODRAFT_410594 [Baudoinia panamericana UAMH 10762]EMC98003.1 hypothetical protein BAUCODRAFT_410594 [Baudoinia panamericana UAMH 10762]
MAGDDDTFEIDIYGDEQQEPEVRAQPAESHPNGGEPVPDHATPETRVNGTARSATADPTPTPTDASHPPRQAAKRKAPDENDGGDSLPPHHNGTAPASDNNNNNDHQQYPDDRPLEPGATPALKLTDLHWWTTEEDLRSLCSRAGVGVVEEELLDLSFAEHKINGKSKGEAYLEFASPQAASAVKREVEAASPVKSAGGVRKTPFGVVFAGVGNPFRTVAGAGGKKEFGGGERGVGRGGAYNEFGNRGWDMSGMGGGGKWWWWWECWGDAAG